MFIPKGFLREYFGLFVLIVRMLDICAVLVAGWGAYCYKFKSHMITAPYLAAICVGIILAMFLFRILQLIKKIAVTLTSQVSY